MPPTTTGPRRQVAANNLDQARRSSGRQVRASISRPTNYYARPLGSVGGAEESQDEPAPPGFFPAIQYFTDSVAAFPREVMRHFTLLKEVEAKVHGPTEEMGHITRRIAALPVPPRRRHRAFNQSLLHFGANTSSGLNSANMSMIDGSLPGLMLPSATELAEQVAEIDPQLDLQRRQEFHNLKMVIGQVLANLDEKNVCLAEANRTLQRQMNRMESVIPHLESEIGEDARLGSLSHWAYADNRKKQNQPAAERSRRDVAATTNLAAAAAAIHEGDIAAARNETRKETKKSRAQHVDTEAEDKTVKKATGRGRKPAEEAKPSNAPNGATQAPKKRKIDKPSAAGMERVSSNAGKSFKAQAGPAAKSTAAAEPARKKAKPALPLVVKKRTTNGGSPLQSPRVAASPIMANFALPHEQGLQRPSSRMRQGSSTLQHSTLPAQVSSANQDGIKEERRASAAGVRSMHSERQDGQKDTIMEDANDAPPVRSVETSGPGEAQANKASSTTSGGSREMKDEGESTAMMRTRSTGVRNEVASHAVKSSANKESRHGRSSSSGGQHILKQIASFNRSPTMGRPSLPGTEDEGSGSDTKSVTGATGTKSGREARALRRTESKARSPEEEDEPEEEPEEEVTLEADEMQEDDEEQDPDDPNAQKYCYCGRGSYGIMVGCENSECEREWFHLDCIGLKAAPAEDVKWYCDDCDPRGRKKAKSGGRH